VAAVIAALFLWRTAMEDGTLLRELPGYAEYAAQTRWRLMPGVW
jgi:protein-S-isoprenylcysteine O-methyltransferase Ste14